MYCNNSLGKRLLSLLLSAVLVLGMVPVNQVNAAETPAVFSFENAAPEKIEYKKDATFQNPASGGEGNGAVTYALLKDAGTENPEEVQETDVAKIDQATGELTLLKAGVVTVRATKAADEEAAAPEQTAEYTLTIVQPAFGFEEAEPEALAFAADLTFTNSAYGGDGEGKVTYALLEEVVVDPEEPGTDPEDPSTDPEDPSTDPEDPSTDPEDPSTDPEDPSTDPEDPSTDPEDPSTDPENPSTDPEDPSTDPEDPGTDPEEPGTDSGEPKTEIVEVTKTDVAEIDPKTGELTILKSGTVTVRARKAADGDIKEQIAEYTLVINLGEQTGFIFTAAEPFIAYSSTEKYLYEAAGGAGEGAITYAIKEGSDYATIDSQTGELTTNKVGKVVIIATKAADEKYLAATAEYALEIVRAAQTGFAFAEPNPAPVVYDPDNCTYTNIASGGEVEDGAVIYQVTDGSDVATVNTDTGELTIHKIGTVTVQATKEGNANYHDATAEYSLTVTKPQQTGFAFKIPNPDALDYEEGLTFTNEAEGGQTDGAVTYEITDGSHIASIDKDTGKLTIQGHGTVKVKATKQGDENFDAAEAEYTLVINGKEQAPLTFDKPNPETQAYVSGMTFSNPASGGSGDGAITYEITEGANIASLGYNGTLIIRGEGKITVVATKAADNVYKEATATYTVQIGKEQDPFVFENENVTITYAKDAEYRQTATGGSGNGAVSYSIRAEDWAVATIDSTTGRLSIKKSGTVVVTAVKAAAYPYAASTATYTLTIEKAEQTGFGFENDEVTVTYGDNNNRFLLNAAGGESSSNVITYSVPEDNGVVEKIENSNEVKILKSGTVEITAVKSGDDCYKDSPVATLTLTVNKASQTIRFDNDSVEETYGILNYTQEAIVIVPHNDEPVVYTIEGKNQIGASINKDTGELTFGNSKRKVGSITVKATKPADDCYKEASAEYTFTLVYSKSPSPTYTLEGDTKNNSGWYTGNVTIHAPEGYQISRFDQLIMDPNAWSDSVTCDTEGENKDYTIYLKNQTTGRITRGVTVEGLKIDKTKPVALKIEYKDAAWYEILKSIFGFSQKTVEVFFSASDPVSGIASMEYSLDGGDTYNPLKGMSISIPAEYRDQVVLRVTDVAGNVVTSQDDEAADNDGKTLVVDMSIPVIKTKLSDNYVLNEEDGIYYANSSNFTITFTVTDNNYDLRAENPVVKVNDAAQDLTWDSSDESGMAMLALPAEGHYTVTADFADRSENAAEQFKAVVYVDMTAPERTVTFNTPSRTVDAKTMLDKEDPNFTEADDIVAYYSTDAVATIEITETNFVPDEVTVTVNGEPVTVGEWTSDEEGTWTNTVTLTEEGDNVLAVSYTDRAGHAMENYVSQRIVIDKTLPEVSVVYGNEDVKNTIKGRDYFDAEQTATITIQEKNFRADDVRILVTAKDVNGVSVLENNEDEVVKAFADQGMARDAWTPYVEGTWRSEDETYELTLVFAEDANYTFDVVYADLAAQQAADYEEDAFTVDKTAPTNVEIIYSDPVPQENPDDITNYYKDQVTVTVTAEDITSGIHFFDYIYTNAEDVSGVNADLKEPVRIDAKREGAKGTATFLIPKDELTETTQFNGTVTVTAGDRAENGTEKPDTRIIVVDNIAPVADVQYGVSNRHEEKTDFYNDTITGTITITEANFFADCVQVTATKDGEAYPVDVAWEDVNVDQHTGKFTFTEEGRYVVTVAYTDKSGNEMTAYVSQELVLDRTAPVDVNIKYKEGTSYPKVFEEFFGKMLKVFYYNAPTTVELTATDADSGMEGIRVNVVRNGSEGATTAKLPKDLVILADSTTTGETGAIKVTSVTYDEATGKMTAICSIPKEFRGALEIVAVDKGHNEYAYSDDTIVVVDTVDPTRTVTFTPNRAVDIATMKDVDKNSVKEGDKVVLYYKQDAEITFNVTEANFHEEDVKVSVNGKSVKITDWTNVKNDTWSGKLTLKQEGDYVVTATYKDRANNKMIPYTSQRIVIDKTAPVIETKYSKDFTSTQTSNEGEWSRRVYYIDKDLFEAEGEYNIVVSTVDKAETTAYSDVKNLAVAFVVDQTKPVVTITGLETGGRYQTDEQTVVLIPTDEGGRLNSLRVVVYDSDGNPLKDEFGTDISVRFEMSGEEFLKYLESHDGKVTFTVPEGLNNKVQIICNDCAVNAEGLTNEYNELFERVTVSQNKLVIFYANSLLFYGTIAGILFLLWLLIFLLLKRKKEEEEEQQ